MSDIDVTEELERAQTNPQVAAENIKDSQKINVTPDLYNEMKVTLKPLVREADGPTMATRTVASAITEGGNQAASLVKKDISRLNYAEKQLQFTQDKIANGDTTRRRNQSAWDVLTKGAGASDDELFNLTQLQMQVDEEDAEMQKYDFNFGESIPGEVANVGTDYVRGLRDNYKVGLGLAAAASVATGAVGLLAAGPAGAIGGAIVGARAVAPYALRGASMTDSFQQSAGGVYAELNQSHPDMDPGLKSRASYGIGALVATLDAVGEATLIKAVPGLANILGMKKAVKYFTAPGNEKYLQAMANFGDSSLVRNYLIPAGTEGATESIQTLVEIAGKNIATSQNQGIGGSVTDIIDSITDPSTWGEMFRAGTIGSVAGGSFVAVGRAGSNVLNAGRNLDNKSTPVDFVRMTPEEAAEAKARQTVNAIKQDQQPKMFDIQGTEAIQLNLALAQIAESTKNTDIKTMTPEQYDSLIRAMARENGIRKLWVDPTEIDKRITSQEKKEKIYSKLNRLMRPESVEPFQIEVDQAVNLEMEVPGFASIVKSAPDTLSSAQYAEALNLRQQQADQLLGRVREADATPIVDEGTETTLEGVENLEAGTIPVEPNGPMGPMDIYSQLDDETQISNPQIIASAVGTRQNADSVIAMIQNNPTPAAQDQLLLDTISNLRESLPNDEMVDIPTDRLATARVLTPIEITELRARGDMFLNELTRLKKIPTDERLAQRVVTQERANWLMKEIDAEIEDLGAIEMISRAASATTIDQIKSSLNAAGTVETKLKDGRTLQIVPHTENNLPRVELVVAGKSAGSIKFHIESKNGKKTTTPAMTQVHPDFRRQGVATAAYTTIAEKILNFEHSNVQLPDGKAFAQGMRDQSINFEQTGESAKVQKLRDYYSQLTRIFPDLATYNDGRIRDIDINNEQSYLNQQTFTDAIAGVISKEEVQRANEALRSARLEVIEAVDDAAQKEMNQVVEVNVNIERDIQLMEAAEAIQNNPDIPLVEAYLKGTVIGEATPEMTKRMREGKRVIQINENLLDPAQRELFLNNPTLKSRKVFVKKGGMSPGDAATYILGTNDGNRLLEVLATVPTEAEAMRAATKIRLETRQQIEDSVELNETAIAKAYTKLAKTHIEQLKLMKDKAWSTTRRMIKRIALPLPKIEQITQAAKQKISNTQVGDLSVAQYRSGEMNAQRRAVDDITKMKVESAFRNREAAALNAALAKETHIAIGQINRAGKFLARLSRPENMAMLEEAGKIYSDTAAMILDTFTISNSQGRYNAIESYKKYVDKMIAEGRGDSVKFTELQLDQLTRTHIMDLTVDEYLQLARVAQGLFQRARSKNTLMNKYEKAFNTLNKDSLREGISLAAQNNPFYEPGREIQKLDMNRLEKFTDGIRGGMSLMKNMQSIAVKLDNGAIDGFFSRMIIDPLKGIGDFQDGINGQNMAIELEAKFDNRHRTAIKGYGNSAFKSMNLKSVFIPEFRDIKALNNGKITMQDLFEMAKHIGNEDNFAALQNYGMTRDAMLAVLERNLTQKDMDFIQEHVWGSFEEIKPILRAKELETNGVEPNWTQPVSFEMFGKTYTGGYFPIRYRMDANAAGVFKQAKDAFSVNSEKIIGGKDYEVLGGLVKSPHTQERVGGSYLLDLSPAIHKIAMSDVIYDVTMRTPVASVMGILQDKDNATEIMRVVGVRDYNLLLNMVAESTRSYNSRMLQLYNTQQNWLTKIISKSQAATAITQIAFNLSSLVIQFDSMRQVVKVMGGTNAPKYISKAMLKMTTRPDLIPEFIDAVRTFDPSIKSLFDNVEGIAGNSDLIPDTSKSRPVRLFKKGRDASAKLALEKIMGHTDAFMKIVTWHAAYDQYINGEAPRQGDNYLANMSPEEADRRAKAYASKLISKTLTAGTMLDRAAIQKMPVGQLIAYYWNDARNNINNSIQDVRNIRADYIKARNDAKEGNYESLAKLMSGTAGTIATTTIMSLIGLSFQNAVKNMMWGEEDEHWYDFAKPTDEETGIGYLSRLGLNLFNEQVTQNVPVARTVLFAAETGRVPQELTGRIVSDGTDAIVVGASYIREILNGATLEDIELNDKETRALARTGSLLVGGVPVNGPMKFYDVFLSSENDKPSVIGQLLGGAIGYLQHILSEGDKELTDDELMDKLLQEAEQEGSDGSAKQDMNQFIKENTNTVKNDLTNDEYKIIEQMESGGGRFLENPDSSAYGPFQFVKSTWKMVMDRSREQGYDLGLTEAGRYDDRQQRIAMRWLTQDNIRILKNKGMEVDVLNVYGLHHFGPEVWEKAVRNPRMLKTSVFTSAQLKQNPYLNRRDADLGKTPKTAGDVIELQINKIAKAKKALNI